MCEIRVADGRNWWSDSESLSMWFVLDLREASESKSYRPKVRPDRETERRGNSWTNPLVMLSNFNSMLSAAGDGWCSNDVFGNIFLQHTLEGQRYGWPSVALSIFQAWSREFLISIVRFCVHVYPCSMYMFSATSTIQRQLEITNWFGFLSILMSLRLCIRLRVGVSRVVLVFIGYPWSLVPWI